jgi:dynein heavy chain
MNNTFIQNFIRDKTWPDNAKKEFMGQLDKFMATLTE